MKHPRKLQREVVGSGGWLRGLAQAVLGLLACSLHAISSECPSRKQCIQVIGQIEYRTSPSSDAPKPRTFTRKFEILSDGRLWRIVITDATPPQQLVKSWEVGTDGVNIFTLCSYDTNYQGLHTLKVPQQQGEPLTKHYVGPFKSENTAVGNILSGVVPTGHEGFSMSPLIWLMYASGCYLQSQTSNLPPVFHSLPDFTGRGVMMPAQWKTSSLFPNLPTNLAIINPGYLLTMHRGEPARLPIATVYTNLLATVTSVTNVSGYLVPIASHITCFEPDTSQLRATPQHIPIKLSYTAHLVATMVRAHDSPGSFLPRVPSRTAVTDYRASGLGIPTPTFLVSDNWPTVAESSAMQTWLPRGTPKKTAADQLRKFHGGMAIFCGITFTLLAAATLTWLLLRTETKQQTKHM